MPPRYIEIPRESLEKFLIDDKFISGVQGNEVIFTRVSSQNTQGKIVVYTSLSVNKNSARGCGEDAIRVCPLANFSLTDDERWLHLGEKLSRIYRTGSVEKVLARLKERIDESKLRINSYTQKSCRKCGGLTFPDGGNCIKKECRNSWKITKDKVNFDKPENTDHVDFLDPDPFHDREFLEDNIDIWHDPRYFHYKR